MKRLLLGLSLLAVFAGVLWLEIWLMRKKGPER